MMGFARVWMLRFGRPVACLARKVIGPGVSLFLAACAAHPPVQQTQIPFDTAERTLAVGFQQLSERFVEYIPVSTLAFEGLRGLNAIDPDFEAQRVGDSVTFGIGSAHRHSLEAPAESDAVAWAALTLDAVHLVQSDSPEIAVAPVERIYDAIFDGSLSLLDAYSRYAGADEAIRNRERRSGFGGIGVVVQHTARGASIVQVLFDSPAVQAGLVEGDLITHIDQQPVGSAIDPTDVARGAIGTSVALRVERRSGEIVDIDIKRQRVIAPTVEVSVRNDIVTARITGFNRSTTRHLATQLSDQIQRLHGMARGIVLDLRGNPGGLLSEAVRVADLFIREGRILSTRGRHPSSVHDYDAREDDVASGLPMVVLVNGRSASASEIVAAALQDHDRAIVVGSSSYGKGTVQMIVPLPNEGELTVTWSRFVTPSGYFLNGLGVHPSVCTSSGGSADQMIAHTLESGADLMHAFEAWRDIDRHPDADRKVLKALCPPSDAAGDTDGLIAERLIADAGAYDRILAFAPTVMAAHK